MIPGSSRVSRALVLDAEAMAALADRRHPRFDEVRAALEAARRLRRDVVVSAVTLAELYRAPNRNALVDACLSRETGLVVRDTDCSVARLVGGIRMPRAPGVRTLPTPTALRVRRKREGVLCSPATRRTSAGWPRPTPMCTWEGCSGLAGALGCLLHNDAYVGYLGQRCQPWVPSCAPPLRATRVCR